jgi:hypothetical protein
MLPDAHDSLRAVGSTGLMVSTRPTTLDGPACFAGTTPTDEP